MIDITYFSALFVLRDPRLTCLFCTSSFFYGEQLREKRFDKVSKFIVALVNIGGGIDIIPVRLVDILSEVI